MPFSAGELCCAMEACVLIDTSSNGAGTWDKIPHVTEVSFNMQANTPKVVTSSTGGKETSVCGTITQSGTLSIACHKGTGAGYLHPNNVYRIAWSIDCSVLWDFVTCEAKDFSSEENYLDAYIRITSAPRPINISGNQATITQYNFDIVSWVFGPENLQQNPQVGVTQGFVC